MGRETTAAILVLLLLLVGAIIAVIVLAVQLKDAKDEAAASDEQDMTEGLDLDTCDDVAIIGAGISGSYAAWRLRERGWKITLYEYSNRIGGRMHTVNLPGMPDVNVELGAMRFKPKSHTVFNQTAHDLGMEVVDFAPGYGASGETLYYLRGEHMTYSELPTKSPYNIPDEYRYDFNTLKWHVFDNYTKVDPDVTDPMSLVNRQRRTTIDGGELGKQSRQLFDAKFFDSETAKYVSEASSFLSEYGPINTAANLPMSDPSLPSAPNPVMTLSDGFQAMPEKMVEQYLAASNKHSFQRNHHLKSIRKDESGNYILSFQPTETKQGQTEELKNAARRTACAKKVVLGMSQMALQHLDWPVLKNGDIRDMLDNAVFPVVAAKMYFGYDSMWWRNLPKAAPYALSNTPLRQTYDFGKSTTSEKALLNPSYTDVDAGFWRDVRDVDAPVLGAVGGDMSIAMSNTSVYLARKYYSELFDVTMDDVPEPNAAVMEVWDRYPYGASWYEWMPDYYWEEVQDKMLKPSSTDDVFITGNVFSGDKLAGWCEGALRLVDKFVATL